MPITPLEAITFANQNMQVAASKQNDYRNRIEQQSYAAVAKLAQKDAEVAGVGELKEDEKIDGEREHNREQAEEETGEKGKEIEMKNALQKKLIKEEKEPIASSNHILDIKV